MQAEFNMESINSLRMILDDLESELESIDGIKVKNDNVQWLQVQIQNLVFELNGLLSDLEAGLSLAELGFSSAHDFEERIEEIRTQVLNLKALVKTIREIN